MRFSISYPPLPFQVEILSLVRSLSLRWSRPVTIADLVVAIVSAGEARRRPGQSSLHAQVGRFPVICIFRDSALSSYIIAGCHYLWILCVWVRLLDNIYLEHPCPDTLKSYKWVEWPDKHIPSWGWIRWPSVFLFQLSHRKQVSFSWQLVPCFSHFCALLGVILPCNMAAQCSAI